jgi:hypothetical protein
VVNSSLEVRSRGNAILLSPPTIAPQCKGIFIMISLYCCYYIVKHFFYIPPVLVVWRRTASQTGAFATGTYGSRRGLVAALVSAVINVRVL